MNCYGNYQCMLMTVDSQEGTQFYIWRVFPYRAPGLICHGLPCKATHASSCMGELQGWRKQVEINVQLKADKCVYFLL